MRHYLTLVLAIGALLSAYGQHRSISQARTSLAEVLGASRAARLQPIEVSGLHCKDITIMSDAQAGFAVVSHNAQYPAVLAYGDKPIDPTNVSPEFLYLMEGYSAMLSSPLRAPIEETPVYRLGFTDVQPLLKSHWAQGSPYNNLTPVPPNSYGYHCVTGCVATAMAQVLYYYKLPKTSHGWKAYGTTYKSGERIRLSMDFGKKAFNWNDMLDTYAGTSTTAQKTAVAELMYACGIATNMGYNLNESSAVTTIGMDGINCFFDGIRAEHMSFDLDRVAHELNAGRPVIFEGSNGSGGHCFVIDGSNAQGYLHCNLGWGESGDGYYLPTDMNGYSNGQGITCVWPSDMLPTCQPLDELRGKKVTISTENFVTSIEPDRWYVLNNSGRAGSPRSQGKGKEVMNTHNLPSHQRTEYCADQLVRFIPNKNGDAYYIQTGLGDYWGTFTNGGGGKTTATKSVTFTLGPIEAGTMWIKGQYYLDTNGPGSNVVGWGQTQPTDKYSNSAWLIYPATLEDADITTHVSSVTLSRKEMSILTGDNVQLKADVTPRNADVPHVVWRSASDSKATVNADGLVAGKSYGNVNIIATAMDGSAKADTCRLHVVKISEPAGPTRLTNTGLYILRNVGYSQGYLVATDAADLHPTLRGVLALHANGLYAGAKYQEEPDWTSPYSYWQIMKDTEGNHYLYNLGTEKYLTHSGDKTPYTFTSTPTPIHISYDEKRGAWSFNASTQSESYLCAATHLDNPAAFWTADDAGSLWKVLSTTGSGLKASNIVGIYTPVCDTPDQGQENATPRSGFYDIQGKALPQPAHTHHGLHIENGQKVMR